MFRPSVGNLFTGIPLVSGNVLCGFDFKDSVVSFRMCVHQIIKHKF